MLCGGVLMEGRGGIQFLTAAGAAGGDFASTAGTIAPGGGVISKLSAEI